MNWIEGSWLKGAVLAAFAFAAESTSMTKGPAFVALKGLPSQRR